MEQCEMKLRKIHLDQSEANSSLLLSRKYLWNICLIKSIYLISSFFKEMPRKNKSLLHLYNNISLQYFKRIFGLLLSVTIMLLSRNHIRLIIWKKLFFFFDVNEKFANSSEIKTLTCQICSKTKQQITESNDAIKMSEKFLVCAKF